MGKARLETQLEHRLYQGWQARRDSGAAGYEAIQATAMSLIQIVRRHIQQGRGYFFPHRSNSLFTVIQSLHYICTPNRSCWSVDM